MVFTPQKLLERLAALVPHPRVHLVHYHGVLAPAAAWRPRVVPTPAEGTAAATRTSAWIPWAEWMLREFGVDPMVCVRCGLRLEVRAIVRVWDTARKILDDLSRARPQVGAGRCELFATRRSP